MGAELIKFKLHDSVKIKNIMLRIVKIVYKDCYLLRWRRDFAVD